MYNNNEDEAGRRGVPVSDEVRKRWSLRKLVLTERTLLRTDFGGRDPVQSILDRLRRIEGFHRLPDADQEKVAMEVLSVVKAQIAGSARRMSHCRRELDARLFGQQPTEDES